MIEQVLRVLGAAGVPLDYRDMADALWLAEVLPYEPAPPEAPAAEQHAHGAQAEAERASTTSLPSAEPAERRRVRISSGTVLRDEQDLFASTARARVSGASGIRVSRVRVPTAPGLHDAMAIARAMRPLARRFPSRHAQVLDEEATAERSAESRQLTPVFRPARERWFDIALVVEDVPSMALWRRVIAELHRLLQQQGAFRDVRRWTLSFSGGKTHVIDPAGAARPTRELRDPEARRLIIVVSDCLSPAWYGRTMARLLADWGVTTPVAVLQLLPDHLWSNTALGPARARFGASAPGLPNAGLFVERAWWDDDPITGQLPLPVLTLDAQSMGDWSRMLMGMGARSRGIVVGRHLLPAAAVEDVLPDAAVPPADVEERVARFRSLVSLDAYRLATYFAVVPLTLPVMRLVHGALFARPSESQLAEVMLGGIIERVTAPDVKATDDEVEYEFAATPEERAAARGSAMRSVLLRSIRRSEAHRVLAAVSRYLTDRVGTTVDFGAWVRSATGTEALPEAARPFAQLAQSTMRRLGMAVTEGSVSHVDAGTAALAEPVEVDEEVFADALTVMRRIELREPAQQIAWTPNGKLLAVREASEIAVVDAQAGAVATRIGLTEQASAMVWAQSSQELAHATRSPDGDVITIRINTVPLTVVATPIQPPPPPQFRTQSSLVDLDWRAPFDEMALALADGRVRFWQRINGDKGLQRASDLPDRPGTSVRSLSWSTNGESLVVLYDDGEVQIATGYERTQVTTEPSDPTRTAVFGPLVWDPLDRWFAVARHTGTISIMNRSKALLVELTVGNMEVRSLSVSRDGALLAAVADGALLMWRTKDWVLVNQSSTVEPGRLHAVAAFSPSAPMLAYAADDSVHLLRVDEKLLATMSAAAEAAPPAPQPLGDARRVGLECAVIITTGGADTASHLRGGAAAAQRFLDWFQGRPLETIRYAVLLGQHSIELHRAPDEPPTLARFQGALQGAVEQARSTTPEGTTARIYVYFSGLGGHLPTGERVAFVLGDSSSESVPVPVNRYVAALARAQLFDDVVFVCDCDDDMMTKEYVINDWSPSPAGPARPGPMATQVAIHSGRYPTDEKPWAFTEALVSGLSGAAADDHGDVTVSGLMSYLPRERDRLIGERAAEGSRQLLAVRSARLVDSHSSPVQVTILSGNDIVLAHVEHATARVRIMADPIFDGHKLRVGDRSGVELFSFAHETRGEAENVFTLLSGAYMAQVAGLPVQQLFHVSPSDSDPKDITLHWTPTQIRVLIAGTGAYELSPAELLASEQLGRALAQCGHKLVTGGWPGVDHVVARAYAQCLERQGELVENHLTHILEDRQTADFEDGRILHPAGLLSGVGKSLDYADALVVVGGAGGTDRLVRLAVERGTVVIPWGATGGAAEKAVQEARIRAPLAASGNSESLSEPLSDSVRAGEIADWIAMSISRLLDARRTDPGAPA